jgi:hypothetical protein
MKHVYVVVLIAGLSMVACSDTAAPVLEPELEAVATSRAAPARVPVCHVNGQGEFVPLVVPVPAVRGQLAQGASPLIGDWAGGWHAAGFNPLPMDVGFRSDCQGFQPGERLAEVQYFIGLRPLCGGYWAFEGFIPGGYAVIEHIVQPEDPPCVERVRLEVYPDVLGTELRVDLGEVLPPNYPPGQYGRLTRVD